MVTDRTIGIGLTVIEKVFEVPKQLLDTGVTVIRDVIGILLMLVAVKLVFAELPDNGNPMSALELVHW